MLNWPSIVKVADYMFTEIAFNKKKLITSRLRQKAGFPIKILCI